MRPPAARGRYIAARTYHSSCARCALHPPGHRSAGITWTAGGAIGRRPDRRRLRHGPRERIRRCSPNSFVHGWSVTSHEWPSATSTRRVDPLADGAQKSLDRTSEIGAPTLCTGRARWVNRAIRATGRPFLRTGQGPVLPSDPGRPTGAPIAQMCGATVLGVLPQEASRAPSSRSVVPVRRHGGTAPLPAHRQGGTAGQGRHVPCSQAVAFSDRPAIRRRGRSRLHAQHAAAQPSPRRSPSGPRCGWARVRCRSSSSSAAMCSPTPPGPTDTARAFWRRRAAKILPNHVRHLGRGRGRARRAPARRPPAAGPG